MKRAFTLIELLVVIGIIAILSALLLGTFSGASESARGIQCLANMKSLANAALSASSGCPPAESSETVRPYIDGSMAKAKKEYRENVGWISWYSEGLYPSFSSQKDSCHTVSLYSDVVEEYQYALNHGALFDAIGGKTATFVCPVHKDKMVNAHWSYFMNPKAGGAKFGKKIKIGENERNADRVLLFGEIPFRNGSPGEWFPSGSVGNEETDAAIQYDKENIGANHKSAKFWIAHVVFADGHVEKLRASGVKGKPISGAELRQLTKWLCEGVDISFNGSTYEKLTE